jgi:hypothetical protein
LLTTLLRRTRIEPAVDSGFASAFAFGDFGVGVEVGFDDKSEVKFQIDGEVKLDFG